MMKIGSNISRARADAKLTQENLAEKLGVSVQAVSNWETDKNLPDTEKLVLLAETLGVSVDRLVKGGEELPCRDAFFDMEHMKTRVKATAEAHRMDNTVKALAFAEKAHEGFMRKGKAAVPYFVHPLTMACQTLAFGLKDDELLSAVLLHDVVEDTHYSLDDLPVSEAAKAVVALVTKPKDFAHREEETRAYFAGIESDPRAMMVKLLDRCNNVSCMAQGFSREKMAEYIRETETRILPLADRMRDMAPAYSDAAFLLKYQILGVIETIKHLL